MISKIVLKVWMWWSKEQDELCPHCGYYCTGKSIFCLPPTIPPHDVETKEIAR